MKKEKSATNNQWVSTPLELKTDCACSKKKTAGNNQWTSTNKNPINNK